MLPARAPTSCSSAVISPSLSTPSTPLVAAVAPSCKTSWARLSSTASASASPLSASLTLCSPPSFTSPRNWRSSSTPPHCCHRCALLTSSCGAFFRNLLPRDTRGKASVPLTSRLDSFIPQPIRAHGQFLTHDQAHCHRPSHRLPGLLLWQYRKWPPARSGGVV